MVSLLIQLSSYKNTVEKLYQKNEVYFMKKICAVLFTVCILFSTGAFADEFLGEGNPTNAGKFEINFGTLFGVSFFTGDAYAKDQRTITVGTYGIGKTGQGYFLPNWSLGFFVIDNFSIGGSFSYINTGDDDNTTDAYVIDPIVKFYVPITQDFLLNAKGTFHIVDFNDAIQFGFGVGGALTYMINDNVGAFAGIDYNLYFENNDDNKPSYSQVDIGLGVSVFF